MKTSLAFVWCLAGALFARADIIFQGYMTAPEGPLFVLSVGKERTSGWLGVGQKFDGFTIMAFDSKAELLTVEKDGKRSVIHIVEGRTLAVNEERPGPATRPIVILIGKSESISVGDDVAMVDALKKKFELVAAMNPRPTVTLRPPGETSFDRLRLVIDLCREAGITRFDIKAQ